MKTILSVLAAAAMLLSALSACGTNTRGRTAEARVTPVPTAAAGTLPAQTARPEATSGAEGLGDKAADAAKDAGDMVGDAVEGVGDAVGGAARDAGNAVGDMLDNDAASTARPRTTARP